MECSIDLLDATFATTFHFECSRVRALRLKSVLVAHVAIERRLTRRTAMDAKITGTPTRQVAARRPAVPRLDRTTFATSRLLDFCSEKELTAQTGHEIEDWPRVIVKELVDNALDACEEAGIAPEIEVTVEGDAVTVADNGPGLPASTVKSILDFTVRISSREAYVSPTRGAQGNALKTILAMPFVLSGNQAGRVEIETQGRRHCIVFEVDHIRQAPVIQHAVQQGGRKKGTLVRVEWPDSACSILDGAKGEFLQIASDYCWLNPHLKLTIKWSGDSLTRTIEATRPDWVKWLPSHPTSAHWYSPDRFERLIAAYVAHGADKKLDRTVREFVSEFRGLSGSAKQKLVLGELGLAREPLSSLVADNRVNSRSASALLQAMQKYSKPVKPAMLGIIGREHFETRFETVGCEMESFNYRKIEDHDDDGIPFVIETAFGWLGDNAPARRRLVTGVNWSPGIKHPFRRLGPLGQSLDSVLELQRVGRDEPVVFVLHVSCPRVEYLDRGKSSVVVRS